MKKRLLSILLTLCILLCIVPVSALADDTALRSVAVQSIGPSEAEVELDLYEKMSAQVSVIKLISDIELSGSLQVDYAVTINLNGHVLKMGDIADGSVIKVNDGGHLTLIDSAPDAEHKFTPNADGLWVLDETSGTETISGGVITGGTGTVTRYFALGGGVYVEGGGEFTMTAGNIVGCTAKGSSGISAFGGGVYVAKNGTFTMTGGSITGCTATAPATLAFGGGIRNDGEWKGDIGHTTLSDTAVIRDCHAKDASQLDGGGISDGGMLTISGDVKIIGCTAGGMGSDAMYVNANNDSSVTGGTFYGSIKDLGNKIHGITVKYHLNNDKNYATQVLQSGTQITLPDPAKEGHAFDGWYKDGTKWEKTTLVTESLTLTGWLYAPVTNETELKAALADDMVDVIRLASDIKLSNELQITNNRKVTLDLNGYVLDPGGKYILVSALSGDPWYHLNQLTIIDSDPTNPHKFTDNDGLWKLDDNGDKTVSGGIITGGSDGSSAITAGSRGTVTMNGGNIVGCSTFGDGGAVSARNGTFIMNGGSIIGCKTDFAGGAVYVLNGNFIMNSGSITNCVVTSPAGDGGAVYVIADGTFTMNGGSIADCTAVNGSALYLKNGTMNAGGGTVGGTVVLEKNSTIQGSDSTFSGLIINNDVQTQFSGAHSPLGIVGEEPIGANGYSYHKIAFDTVGGNMSHTMRYFLQGKDISNEIKPDPRTGYTFGGWNKADGTAWDFTKDTVTENITLSAKWIPHTYTVTFDSTGGSEVTTKTMTATYGKPLANMPVPRREGYVFLGWYDAMVGGKCYGNSDGNGTSAYDKDGNITLYAQWTVAPSHMVYLNTCGGTMTGSTEVLHKTNTPIAKPSDPTKVGYTFTGWYTDSTFTQAWNFDDWVTGELRLYAGWTVNQYTITIKPENGEADTIIKQDFGTAVTAPNLTKTGYTFVGWDKTFPTTMPAENITVTAQWKDSEKPTGKIKISENSWKSFINNITFGLFFKDTQMVTINAADNSGDAVKIEYLMSAKKLTETELASVAFTAYTAPFGIDPDNEYIIYVRLTDKAGNVSYICSDGIVLDGTSPVIKGIENGKIYCEAQTITIDEKYIDTVIVNETKVTLDENNSFVLSPADGEQKIVVTDKASNTAEMTVTVNDGHTFGEWTSNGDGTHTRQCTADGCTEGVETDNCTDEDKNHKCDICDYIISECADTDKNHICDICGKIISNHEDANKDHVCDYCGKTISNHEDSNKDHACDYCGKTISNHEDANKDHVCDYCGKTISNHEDANKDHVCDYCGKIISNHEDANKDHVCDYCGKTISNHEDANKDHVCDYCGKTISNHEDANKDHVCDYCGKTISNHEDTNKDHVCDYCGKTISNHEDADKDHICDYCGKVITNHIGGKETCRDKAVCEVCGKSYGELDAKNHTDLKHFPAKAATKTTEGNIEYWYCEGCGKYFNDKDGTKEIKKADTVTAKLKDDSKSPQTGDTSNLALWIVLLFVSNGAAIGTTVVSRKKKYNR